MRHIGNKSVTGCFLEELEDKAFINNKEFYMTKECHRACDACVNINPT